MTKTSETILFFGSGPVAAKSLDLLHQQFSIEAVITKPRPEHHRGLVPVIETAERLQIPIYTAVNKDSLDSLFKSHTFLSQVAILIDFGIIVSQYVIDYFPFGIINSHFSLLPEWRGADPITFAILSGQKETGVSLMLLVAAMDQGPLLAQERYKLSEKTTGPELTEGLVKLSYKLLCTALPPYLQGKIQSHPQDNKLKATYSRRLTKEDGVIDWHKPATQIDREIRAFLGWPQSRTVLAGKEVILTETDVVERDGPPGQVVRVGNKLVVYTTQNAIEVLKLKPIGKPEMTASAFLAGYGRALLS